MGLNEKFKEPGLTNKQKLQKDQHSTTPEQSHFTPGIPKVNSTLSARTSRSSTSNYKSSTNVAHHRRNMLTMISYPLKKGPFYPREGGETHRNKPQYEGSEIPIPIIHMVKKTFKFTKTRKNHTSKTKNILKIKNKKRHKSNI